MTAKRSRESGHTPWEEIYRSEGHVYTEIHPIIPGFAELAAEHGCRRILDVGCGNGRHLVYFGHKGCQIVGLDNAPTALHLAKEWLEWEDLPGYLLEVDARQPFPFQKEAFDALISTQVVHHARLETVLQTFDEITRVVRPGGLILISVPVFSEDSQKRRDSVEIEPHTFVPLSGREKGLPHHLFAMDELRAAFPGFDILSLEQHGSKVLSLTGVKRPS